MWPWLLLGGRSPSSGDILFSRVLSRALRGPSTCVCFDRPERSLPAPLALDGKRRCLFVKLETTFCPSRSSAVLPGLLHKAHAACQGCWGSFGSVFGTSSRATSSARGRGNVCPGLKPLQRLSTATGQTGRGWDGDRAHASGTGTAGYAAPAMRRGGRRKDRGAHASPDGDTGPNERVSSRRTAPAARNPARRLPRSIWALLPSQAFTTRRPGLRRSRLDAAAWPSPVHGISPAAAHFALLVSPCPWLQSELPAHPAPRAHPQCHRHHPLATA